MYQQCDICVIDSTADEFVKTDTGCYFCDLARKMKPSDELPEIKGKVLLGLSGGLDSSYSLLKLKEMGVDVLCFTIDNGYNTAQADENIMKLVEGMKVPFFRYTIDTDTFKSLQAAFMKAGQKNIEIPTDHILMAATYEIANKYGIKTIISGGNWATESIMPMSWGYQPRDLTHIRDIYKRYTRKRLMGLPVCGLWKFNYYKWIRRIRTINLLDYFDYTREKAIKELEQYDYKPFEEKHTENYFTWWFQNFYLFEKFGIDKRKAHLSSLIVSGQMTRDEAMFQLTANPIYPSLGIEERVLQYKKRPYTDFKTDEKLWDLLSKIIKYVRSF